MTLALMSLANAAPHTFTIEEASGGPDTTPPLVISTSPPNNSLNVPVDKNITVAFDEPVIAGANYSGIVLKNSSAALLISGAIAGNTLTIFPTGGLSFGENYFVQIPEGAINDASGNVLASQYTFRFSTASPIAMLYHIILSVRNKSGGIISDARVRISNGTNIVIPEFLFNAANISKDAYLESERKYTVEYTLPAGQMLRIRNINITKNTTLSPQFTDNYTGYSPSSVTPASDAVAFNDSGISYDSVEISLRLVREANAIVHCTAWNYAAAECSNWEIWMLSNYTHFINSTQLSFNVSSFDAYMAGYYTPPASCSDNIQNGDETGTDCGGSCPACNVPAPPAQHISPSGGGINPASNSPETVEYTTAAKITNYPKKIDLSRNITYNLAIVVRNTGMSDLNGLSLKIDSDWFSLDETAFRLAKGETRTIPMNLLVPPQAKAGPYAVALSLEGYDNVTFILTVLEKEGMASVAEIDTEVIRKGIEDSKKRIELFREQGYDVSRADKFIVNSEALFKQGNILGSLDYLSLANDAVDGAVKKKEDTKVFLVSYVMAGIIVTLLVLLYHYWKKYKEEKYLEGKLHGILEAEQAKGEQKGTKATEPEMRRNMAEPDDEGSGNIFKRIEEIRKRAGNDNSSKC